MTYEVFIAEELGCSIVAGGRKYVPGSYAVEDVEVARFLKEHGGEHVQVRELDEGEEPQVEGKIVDNPGQSEAPLTPEKLHGGREVEQERRGKKPCSICGRKYRNVNQHLRMSEECKTAVAARIEKESDDG